MFQRVEKPPWKAHQLRSIALPTIAGNRLMRVAGTGPPPFSVKLDEIREPLQQQRISGSFMF